MHCDIGGAYENQDLETIDEIGTSVKDWNYTSNVFKWEKPVPVRHSFNSPEEPDKTGLEALKQDLIDEYWYTDKELEIHWDWGYTRLEGKRKIKKEYSYIPLHFMEEYCNKTTMKKYITIPIAPKYPLDDSFLEEVKEQLHKYVFDDGLEWKFKSDGQLAKEAYEREEKEEELRKKTERLAKIKQIEEDIKSGKYLEDELTMKQDNLDPRFYSPKILEKEIEEKDCESSTEVKPIMLDEVVVYGFSKREALKKLRHEYLHWSSYRDWFGMEPPNSNRKRDALPKE
ncbi:hypothetical protein [Flavobacterium sp. PL002]|uniref:hypothetical protein n=1 Tax=Flavobacterium sp. PL002 TaxID=1897058 RepID=UPI00178877D9|nr:hypothetical protein [Flavobacterium sp. PL002]MBE0392329.1 hypothetical protein [Flavobacterium sp. PL002]